MRIGEAAENIRSYSSLYDFYIVRSSIKLYIITMNRLGLS